MCYLRVKPFLGVYGPKDYEELIEEFPTRCHRCRREVPHARVEVTRRDTIFRIPFRTIGEPHSMVRCRHCGLESHIRDMPDLASPISKAKYTYALRAAAVHLLGDAPHHDARDVAISAIATEYSIYTNSELDADRAARIGEQLAVALDALHFEAGPHLARRFVEQLIPLAAAVSRSADDVTEALRPIAEALKLTPGHLERSVESTLTGE